MGSSPTRVVFFFAQLFFSQITRFLSSPFFRVVFFSSLNFFSDYEILSTPFFVDNKMEDLIHSLLLRLLAVVLSNTIFTTISKDKHTKYKVKLQNYKWHYNSRTMIIYKL